MEISPVVLLMLLLLLTNLAARSYDNTILVLSDGDGSDDLEDKNKLLDRDVKMGKPTPFIPAPFKIHPFKTHIRLDPYKNRSIRGTHLDPQNLY